MPQSSHNGQCQLIILAIAIHFTLLCLIKYISVDSGAQYFMISHNIYRYNESYYLLDTNVENFID